MLFSIGIVLGLVTGGLLLRFAPRQSGGWLSLVLGLLAVVVFVAGWRWNIDLPPVAMPLAIALPFAALLFSLGSVLRGDRVWTNWVGLMLSAAPGLFWTLFAIGEVVGPPH